MNELLQSRRVHVYRTDNGAMVNLSVSGQVLTLDAAAALALGNLLLNEGANAARRPERIYKPKAREGAK